jgi:hypothetical protein
VAPAARPRIVSVIFETFGRLVRDMSFLLGRVNNRLQRQALRMKSL